MTFLSGLSGGLISNNVSGLIAAPVTHFSFQYDDRPTFRSSLVDRAMWEGWQARTGVVHGEPLGHTTFNGRNQRDEPLEFVLWGVRPGSFMDVPVASGNRLGAEENGVVISRLLADRGVKIGDTITLDRVLTELKVIGVTADERNYEHAPILFATLRKWQEATYGPPGGAPPGEQLPDVVFDFASAVALDLQPTMTPEQIAAADTDLGTTTLTREASFQTSPAYQVEVFTVAAIQAFLVVTSAVLLGAFFLIWTIQRTAEIGLVKALGASNGYLLRDSLGQALVLLLGGLAVGVGLAVLSGIAFKATAEAGTPFQFQPATVALSSLFLLAAGLIGGAVSIRRITAVEPLIALGRDR
jgi:putative ABC transport system permease protein